MYIVRFLFRRPSGFSLVDLLSDVKLDSMNSGSAWMSWVGLMNN
jgi:hypothetical protein